MGQTILPGLLPPAGRADSLLGDPDPSLEPGSHRAGGIPFYQTGIPAPDARAPAIQHTASRGRAGRFCQRPTSSSTRTAAITKIREFLRSSTARVSRKKLPRPRQKREFFSEGQLSLKNPRRSRQILPAQIPVPVGRRHLRLPSGHPGHPGREKPLFCLSGGAGDHCQAVEENITGVGLPCHVEQEASQHGDKAQVCGKLEFPSVKHIQPFPPERLLVHSGSLLPLLSCPGFLSCSLPRRLPQQQQRPQYSPGSVSGGGISSSGACMQLEGIKEKYIFPLFLAVLPFGLP